MKRGFALLACVVFSAMVFIGCGDSTTEPGNNDSNNKALEFGGTDDSVDCGNDASLNITELITIAVWVKGDSTTSSYARIVDKYRAKEQEGYDLARAAWSNSVFIEFQTTDGDKQQCAADTPIFDNSWHHVAATYDGDAIKIYVDGALENENVIGKKYIEVCSDNLMIGNGFDGWQWFPFKGCIDELSIWNTALDSLEIQTIMANPLGSVQLQAGSGLVAYYRFDTVEDLGVNDDGADDVRDLSVNGNHGDTQGNTTLVSADRK